MVLLLCVRVPGALWRWLEMDPGGGTRPRGTPEGWGSLPRGPGRMLSPSGGRSRGSAAPLAPPGCQSQPRCGGCSAGTPPAPPAGSVSHPRGQQEQAEGADTPGPAEIITPIKSIPTEPGREAALTPRSCRGRPPGPSRVCGVSAAAPACGGFAGSLRREGGI